MVNFIKHNVFVLALGSGAFNFTSDTIKFALTDVDPAAADEFADITEITAHNGYSAGGPAVASVTYTQTSGTATLTGTSPVVTASGGTIGPFRYIYAYDATTAYDENVIGHWDYGSELTLNSGDSVTLTISGSGILTIA